MTYHRRTVEAAKGRWRGILQTFGVPESCLKNKHGPCPMCGGDDRFRWDNQDGSGSFICSQCGAGHGTEFLVKFTGREVRDIWDEVDRIVGNLTADPIPRKMGDEDIRHMMRETYAQTVEVEPGDLVHTYLASRGVDEVVIYPKALRFARALRDGEGGVRPCMVAVVGVPGETKAATMHRTFLRPDGKAKAEGMSVKDGRKLLAGSVPDGACVKLSEYVAGGPLGIAEGIETALSASALYELPVWSALTAGGLAKWSPPEGCEEVAIFGDNDASFTGQHAAFTLARRLKAKGLHVTVHIPERIGTDWNDIHMERLGLK